MRMIVVLLTLCIQVATSAAGGQIPHFKDFPPTDVFRGSHAAPDLSARGYFRWHGERFSLIHFDPTCEP